MLLCDAIRARINLLLKEKSMSAYKLAYKSGISPSNISDVLRKKVSEPTLTTILHICEGADISLKDFFDSDVFKDVEATERKDKKRMK